MRDFRIDLAILQVMMFFVSKSLPENKESSVPRGGGPWAALTTDLITGGCVVCTPAWAGGWSQMHSDSFARLYWVREGGGFIELASGRLTLRPHRLYLIPPHAPGRYVCPRRMVKDWVHFTARRQGLDLFLGGTRPLTAAVPAAARPALDADWADLLAGLPAAAPEPVPRRAAGSLRRILARLLATADATPAEAAAAARRRSAPWLSAVLEYLERRLAETVRLNEIAAVARLHPTYFSNRFTALAGTSPLQYLKRLRIERAQALLWQTRLPVKEIAVAVDFQNIFAGERMRSLHKRY